MMTGFKLVLGTPIDAVPRPWHKVRFPGIMVNAYDILTSRRSLGELRGRGLRRLLGIDDDVELWIDSGGYQFLKRGIRIRVDKIARLYREIDADYYVSLDYPPGPRDPETTRMLKIAKSVESFLRLRSSLRDVVEEGRLVPVFHMATGEGLRLQLCEYTPHASVAAAGGLIPHIMQRSGKGSRKKAVLFLLILRKLWRGRLHALGLASAAMIPLLKAIGVDSGDTQTWRIKAAYGKVSIPGLGERHVSGQRVRFGPAVLRSEEEKKLYMGYIEEARKVLGVDAESLRESFEARALFNAWTLLAVSTSNHGYLGSSKAFLNLYNAIESLRSHPVSVLEEKLAELIAIQPVDEATEEIHFSVEAPSTPASRAAEAAGAVEQP